MRVAATLLVFGLAVATGCSHREQTADADLQRVVRSRLALNPRLNGIDVSADADLNRVTLSGTVPTRQARVNAVDLAKSGEPDPIIVDRMEVKQ